MQRRRHPVSRLAYANAFTPMLEWGSLRLGAGWDQGTTLRVDVLRWLCKPSQPFEGLHFAEGQRAILAGG